MSQPTKEYFKAWHQRNRESELLKMSARHAAKREALWYVINDLPAADPGTVIDYKDSKTGKAYIGLAKKPLMPNENGIGFQGVKIQSENREFIQCSECGLWLSSLALHLRNKHGISTMEYKKKFGFNKATSLACDVMGNKLAKNVNKNSLKIMRSKGSSKIGGGVMVRTREYENKHGTCPEQLKDAIVNYIHRFKRLPRYRSRRDGFPFYDTIINRHGNLAKAFEFYGLPVKKRGVSRGYKFPDGTIFERPPFMEQDAFYDLMVKKCEILQTK